MQAIAVHNKSGCHVCVFHVNKSCVTQIHFLWTRLPGNHRWQGCFEHASSPRGQGVRGGEAMEVHSV